MQLKEVEDLKCSLQHTKIIDICIYPDGYVDIKLEILDGLLKGMVAELTFDL